MEDISLNMYCIFLFFLTLAHTTECAKFERYVKDLEVQSPFSVVLIGSGIACGSLCNKIDNCNSYSYTTSTKTCKMNDKDPSTENVVTSPDTTLYVKVSVCDAGWTTFGFSCYLFSAEVKRSWDSSQAYCESIGGYLVKVENDEENQFLKEVVSSTSGFYFTWIGTRYNDTADEFLWVDGTHVTFNGWKPGSPGTDKGCADYSGTFDWQWNPHWNCNDELAFICEKNR